MTALGTRKLVPLSEIAEVQGGIQKKPARAPRNNRYPFLRVANVTSAGLDLRELHEVELFGSELDRYQLCAGDLLVVEGNGSPAQIGRSVVWDGSINECVHQNHLIRVRPLAGVEPRYLGYIWNSPAIRTHLAQISSTTSGLRTLSVAKLNRVEVPLPPVKEQRRVVEMLDEHLSCLDAGVGVLERATMHVRAFEQSALYKYFVNRADEVMLDSLLETIQAGKSFGGADAPAKEGEWGIIKVSAMTWGQFRPNENKAVITDRADPRFEIHQGDLLISRANTADYVGASVLVGPVRKKLLLSDKSLRLVPRSGVNPEWLWRALQSPAARHQISAMATGTKASMRNISQASLRSIRLPRADAASQQQALDGFAVLKAASDRLRRELLAQSERHLILRRTLLDAAFSGRLLTRDAAASLRVGQSGL